MKTKLITVIIIAMLGMPSMAWEEEASMPEVGSFSIWETDMNKIKWYAMLDTLAMAEGTKGYNTTFGGLEFKSPKDKKFPCVEQNYGGYKSTACGKYQIINTTWKGICQAKIKGLEWTDEGQDQCAKLLIKRAFDDMDIIITKSSFARIVNRLGRVWASLPCAKGDTAKTCKQRNKPMTWVKNTYLKRLRYYKEKAVFR